MTNYLTNGLLDCWELTRLAGSSAVVFLFFFISRQCGGLNSQRLTRQSNWFNIFFFFCFICIERQRETFRVSLCTHVVRFPPPLSLPPFLCFLSALSISLCRYYLEWWCRFVNLPPHFLPSARAIVGPFRQPQWLWRQHYWRKWHGTTFTALSSRARQKTLQLRILQKNYMDKTTHLNHFGENWSWRLRFLLPVKPRILARK